MLADAYYAAGFVKNKYYELYHGTKEVMTEVKSGLTDKTLAQIAQGYAEALFAEDTQEKVDAKIESIVESALNKLGW